MAIFIWLLSILAYGAYLLYLTRRPSDINLGLGILALILGFISFAANSKLLRMLSFVLIFFGVVLTYQLAFARGLFWLWVGGLAAMLFFGSLGLKDD